jgi:succinoglycan biosynthesis transport protein ExoP
MAELELEQERQLRLRDVLGTLRRRRRTVLITLVACLMLTVALALLLPSYYQASGVILIEQQEVPQELVRSVISSYADQRIQTINQRVMTTQNLLAIIRSRDLYADKRKHDSREELLERMRKDVAFKMISADVVDPRSGLPRQATIAFSVAYRNRSPDQAVRVANDLVSLYLNENLSERTQLAQDASSFLSDESTRLQKEVAELEEKLGDFKTKHVEGLPELTPAKMQFLERAEQELRETHARQISLQQQRAYLEAQLAQIKPNSSVLGEDGARILSPTDRLRVAKSQLASDEAIYSPTHPDVMRLKREIAGLESQLGTQPATNDILRELDTAQGELAQARQKYTPDHPDVQRLDKQVAALQAALAMQPAATAPPVGAADLTGAPDNPAYIQLKAQLSGTSSELASLETQEREVRAQMAGYQRDISGSPEIEKEYRQLSGAYETAQLKYREIRSKQMEAQIGQNLEADRKGERFTLIEPPLPPEAPVSPNRPLILILGVLLSLVAAAVATAIREATDATVRGRSDVVALLEAPPLGVVPRIVTQADLRTARRHRRMALWAIVAGCLVAIILTHLLFRPLDVLWFTALRHFGM